MLVIDPEECIDCGVCEAECPEEAILPDSMEAAHRWLDLNAEYSDKWPVITVRKTPPEDADEYSGLDDKFREYFSATPGPGE